MERSLTEEILRRGREGKPYYEPVNVADLGTIYVKRLNVGEKDAYEKATPDNKISRAATLAHCCFDDRGARLFDDGHVHDLEQLDEPWVDEVVKTAVRLNGYSKEEQEAVLKNSNGRATNS